MWPCTPPPPLFPAIVDDSHIQRACPDLAQVDLTIVDEAERITRIKRRTASAVTHLPTSLLVAHSLDRHLTLARRRTQFSMPCKLFSRKQKNTAASSPAPAMPSPAPVAGSSRSSASQPRLPPSPPKQSKPIPIPPKRRVNNNSGGLYEDPPDPRVGIPEYLPPSSNNKGKRRK